MSNLVESLLKERKYPFIFTFSALLIWFMILLYANTTTFTTSDPKAFYPDVKVQQPLDQHQHDPPPPPPLIQDSKDRQELPPKRHEGLLHWEKAFDTNNFSVDLNINWKLCKGVIAVDYIPCLDNMKVIKALRTRRHMEHRERHCPKSISRCLLPLPKGYKVPVAWPKSRDMVRLILW